MKVISDYLISSFLFSLIAVPFVVFFRFKHYRKNPKVMKEIAILLFFMTCTMIFCQTAIPPQFLKGEFTRFAFHRPDFYFYRLFPQTQYNWLLWKIALKDWADIAVNIGGNLLIFIPIGLLAPYIWKSLKAKAILIGFALSCFVEFIQLFTDRNSDYNDIILNTIGTAFGYLIFLFIKKYAIKKAENNLCFFIKRVSS